MNRAMRLLIGLGTSLRRFLLTLTQPNRKGWPCVYALLIRLNQVLIDFQGSDDSDEVMRRFLPPVK